MQKKSSNKGEPQLFKKIFSFIRCLLNGINIQNSESVNNLKKISQLLDHF